MENISWILLAALAVLILALYLIRKKRGKINLAKKTEEKTEE